MYLFATDVIGTSISGKNGELLEESVTLKPFKIYYCDRTINGNFVITIYKKVKGKPSIPVKYLFNLSIYLKGYHYQYSNSKSELKELRAAYLLELSEYIKRTKLISFNIEYGHLCYCDMFMREPYGNSENAPHNTIFFSANTASELLYKYAKYEKIPIFILGKNDSIWRTINLPENKPFPKNIIGQDFDGLLPQLLNLID